MSHMRSFLTVAFAIIAIVVLGFLAARVYPVALERFYGAAPSQATSVKTSCERPPGFLLIIASISGFNESVNHESPSNPWPVIQVHQGDVVRLLVCNEDTRQPHGFAIENYLDAGVFLGPGEAYKITFSATVPGNFLIYCNIFCTVHSLMVGRLSVSN